MKKEQNLVKIAAAISIACTTVFSTAQSASAIMANSFTFIDKDGLSSANSFLASNEVITGKIIFNNLEPGDSATNIAADSVFVTTIPSFLNSSWGDGSGMQVGIDLTQFDVGNNEFDLSLGIISRAELDINFGGEELIIISNNLDQSFIYDINGFDGFPDLASDDGNDTLSYAEAAVPFEFSPSFGLFLIGGIFGISRYVKSHQANKALKK